MVAAKHELIIKRTFDAPRDLVFKAWTERERALQWWGPKDFTVPHLEMEESRVGGKWFAIMRGPDGKEYPQRGVCTEYVFPERFAFTFEWIGEPHPEMLVTITFEEKHGKTEMIFRQAPFESVEERDGHREGWTESFDRLEAYLASV